ncbi:MAG: tetratricopeptide repeat protein [Alphaproteobacteria bacterium]|jgi:Flp pilus assembly protein TadD|nr:tetratricopeptide repeat protein [Alphaproteobacteria bacterium]MBT4966442.1 tetratricopeptide repeat protein [Alphaproteobacteria bacterium]MBT5160618.1 tetratricopeptide repeat protein [Alphaproteobacteria bacterium]MBT5917506.1 tetratricopeptide repeat protein [Alphaproteobacteria bacterium]MBT6386662.1 tetratricopeptide repeat protein [Alphaproteobacteria bacterium]
MIPGNLKAILFAGLLPLLVGACAQVPDFFKRFDETKAVENSLRKVAVASQQTQDYGAAVRYYEQLHERNPEDIESTLGYARNLRYVGTPARAVQMLEEVLADGLENSRLLSELGRALIASGKPERAITPLTEAVSTGLNDWRTISALGIANDQLGRHAKARNYYRQAQRISPENTAVLNNLALSWALSGDLERSLMILERANKMPGATAQVRQNLALLYGVKGDDKRAHDLARLDLPEDSVQDNLRYYVNLREGDGSKPVVQKTDGPIKGPFALQVGKYPSAEDALNNWLAMQRQNKDLLSSYDVSIHDSKDGGPTPILAWVGPVNNLKKANYICLALSSRSLNCQVVRP